MRIRIIAVGTKMPTWVIAGFLEYAKRFPPGWELQLQEIPAEKRYKTSDIPKLIQLEGEKILSYIKPNHLTIALAIPGQAWSTEQLAKNLTQWRLQNSHIDFLVGGPDGLSNDCLSKANYRWSLSNLTLPHPLVRIILAEQLYRGVSLINHHPYHR